MQMCLTISLYLKISRKTYDPKFLLLVNINLSTDTKCRGGMHHAKP